MYVRISILELTIALYDIIISAAVENALLNHVLKCFGNVFCAVRIFIPLKNSLRELDKYIYHYEISLTRSYHDHAHISKSCSLILTKNHFLLLS